MCGVCVWRIHVVFVCDVCMCLSACVCVFREDRCHVSWSITLCLVPLRWGPSLRANGPQWSSFLCPLQCWDIPEVCRHSWGHALLFMWALRDLNSGPHAHTQTTLTCWAFSLGYYYNFKLIILIDALWSLFMALLCMLQWCVCARACVGICVCPCVCLYVFSECFSLLVSLHHGLVSEWGPPSCTWP